MRKIIKAIRNAKRGSHTYQMIEEVAAIISEENPERSDEDNWFEAQDRISRYLLEEKLAEKMFEDNPDISYDAHLEKAVEKIEKIDLKNLEKLASRGTDLEKILECNLKYFSNYYYNIRKDGNNEESRTKAFEDWDNAIKCVAYNLSLY